MAKVTNELEQRIHIKEFLISHSELSRVQQAGFKALAGNKTFMRPSEFEQILVGYTTPAKKVEPDKVAETVEVAPAEISTKK